MKDLPLPAWLRSHRLSHWLLRVGLAVVFVYASVSSLHSPQDWVGYFPSFIRHMSNAETLIKLFSIYELLLAIWLVSGYYVRYAAALTALTLGGIVVSNPTLFAISFRDIALIFAALALMTDADPKR